MQLLLILSLLFAPLTDAPSGSKADLNIKYKVSGSVLFISYSQGGAYREYNRKEVFPLPDYRLRVVRIDGTKTTDAGWITTDENGHFSIHLEPGTYGFLNETDIPIARQYLPTAERSGDEFSYSSSTWEINTNGPVQVVGEDLNNIVITNHRSSICMLCP